MKNTNLVRRYRQMVVKDGAGGHHVTLTEGIVRDSAGVMVVLEGTFIKMLKVLCFST